MRTLFDPLTLRSGAVMKNRFMLAPLTNQQSHDDGRLSEDEFRWLTMRAQGGFGLTMTCAASVQAVGRGFPGQLGVHDERHLPGLSRLAQTIRRHDSLAIAQLHHAGLRAPPELIDGPPVAPSPHEASGARALSTAEVEQLAEDFIAAALRCERAGFDGVELHGAHSYILTQFQSAELNRRTDRYGGDRESRSRLLFDIIDGVRARCRPGFVLGVRLSPERYGLKLADTIWLVERALKDGRLDFVDLSMWDIGKQPEEPEYPNPLMSYFIGLPRGETRLGAAGKIMSGATARREFEMGLDFITLGRAGILHHDFPARVQAKPDFEPVPLPVSVDYLHREGLSDAFVAYMNNWPGFVSLEEAA